MQSFIGLVHACLPFLEGNIGNRGRLYHQGIHFPSQEHAMDEHQSLERLGGQRLLGALGGKRGTLLFLVCPSERCSVQ